MSYNLEFKRSALKEWNKLNPTLKRQFKKKLHAILINPHIPTSAISGGSNLYKIKLRNAGYRLVYQVIDQTITVTVIAVGKRNRNEVYDAALRRLDSK